MPHPVTMVSRLNNIRLPNNTHTAKRSDALSVNVLWGRTSFGQVHKKNLLQKNFVPYFILIDEAVSTS